MLVRGHAAPALGRSRLRPLRPRRLARPAGGHRRHRRRAGLGHPRLHRAPWCAGSASTGVDARAVATRFEGERDDVAVTEPGADAARGRHESLRRPLHRARRDDRDQREGRGAGGRTSRSAPPADAAWAVYFLTADAPSGWSSPPEAPRAGRPRRPACPSGCSRSATTRSATWPRRSRCSCPTPARVERALPAPLGRGTSAAARAVRTTRCSGRRWSRAWRELDRRQRFVWNKLITGGFRVGVSQQLVTRALARGERRGRGRHRPPADGRLGADAGVLPAAWSRRTSPTPTSAGPTRSSSPIRWKRPPESLGDPADWQAEWKWDGIRAQLIRRGGTHLPLVARRGAGHRALSRAGGGRRRSCPTAPSSTARSCPGTTARRCPSPSCSGGSAARPWAGRSSPRCRWSSSPTTCWRRRARTCGRCR